MLGWMVRCSALVIAMAAFPVAGSAHSAAELYQDCSDSHGSGPRIACLSYLHGLMDGLAAASVLAVDQTIFRYCPPRGELSVSELRLIFVNRVAIHQDKLTTDAGLFLAEALMDSFACPPGK